MVKHYKDLNTLINDLQGTLATVDIISCVQTGVTDNGFKTFSCAMLVNDKSATLSVHGSELMDCQNGESLESYLADYIQGQL